MLTSIVIKQRLMSSMFSILLFCLFPNIVYALQNQPEFIQQIQQNLITLHKNLVGVGELLDVKIAIALAKSGSWEDAIQVINAKPAYNQAIAYGLSHLALVASSIGNIEKMKQFTEATLQIERYGDETVVALGNFARAASMVGDKKLVLDYMEQTTQMIEDSLMYSLWMIPKFWDSLAEFLMQQGENQFIISQLERLIRVANTMKAFDKRDRVLASIAKTFAYINEVEKAQKLVETFEYGPQKSFALLEIADICVAHGKFDQAIQIFYTALSIEEQDVLSRSDYGKTQINYERSRYFSRIGNTLAKAGKIDQARQFLQEALQEIEKVEARTGNPMEVLLDISRGFAQIGTTELAIQIIDKAIQRAGEIDDNELWLKSDTLNKIANLCVEIGTSERGFRLIEQSFKLIEGMQFVKGKRNDPGKAHVLAENAKIYARLDQFDNVLNMLKQIGNPNDYEWVEDTWYYKADVLVFITQLYDDMPHLQQVYHITNITVEDPYEKAIVLAAILSTWAEQQYPQLKGIQAVRILNERDLL
jgi:tetratricopeptide (TPR) repeat protein